MLEFFVSFGTGALIIFFGIMHMRGNISSLHSYHRNKVVPENIPAFGRLVGLGTILCGVSLIIFSGFGLLTEITGNDLFVLVGSVIMTIGFAVGLAISLYAIKKYNGSIF